MNSTHRALLCLDVAVDMPLHLLSSLHSVKLSCLFYTWPCIVGSSCVACELSSVLCDDLEGWQGGGREAQEGGTCAYLRLIHAVGRQKLTRHCKAIILRLRTRLLCTPLLRSPWVKPVHTLLAPRLRLKYPPVGLQRVVIESKY